MLNFSLTSPTDGTDQSLLLKEPVESLRSKLNDPNGDLQYAGFSVPASMVLMDAAATLSQMVLTPYYTIPTYGGPLPFLDFSSARVHDPGIPCSPDAFDGEDYTCAADRLDQLTSWYKGLMDREMDGDRWPLPDVDGWFINGAKPPNTSIPDRNVCWVDVRGSAAYSGYLAPLLDAQYMLACLGAAVSVAMPTGLGLDDWLRTSRVRLDHVNGALKRAVVPVEAENSEGLSVLAAVDVETSSRIVREQVQECQYGGDGAPDVEDGKNPFSGDDREVARYECRPSVKVEYRDMDDDAVFGLLRDMVGVDVRDGLPEPFDGVGDRIWAHPMGRPEPPVLPSLGILAFGADLVDVYRDGMFLVRNARSAAFGPWSPTARALGVFEGSGVLYGPPELYDDGGAGGYANRIAVVRTSPDGSSVTDGPDDYFSASVSVRYVAERSAEAASRDPSLDPIPYPDGECDALLPGGPADVGGVLTSAERITYPEPTRSGTSVASGLLYPSVSYTTDPGLAVGSGPVILSVRGLRCLDFMEDDEIEAYASLPFSVRVTETESSSVSSSGAMRNEQYVPPVNDSVPPFPGFYRYTCPSARESSERLRRTRVRRVYGRLKVPARLLRPRDGSGDIDTGVFGDVFFLLDRTAEELVEMVLRDMEVEGMPDLRAVSFPSIAPVEPVHPGVNQYPMAIPSGDGGGVSGITPAHILQGEPSGNASQAQSDRREIVVTIGSSVDLGPYPSPPEYGYAKTTTYGDLHACGFFSHSESVEGDVPPEHQLEPDYVAYPDERGSHLAGLASEILVLLKVRPRFLSCL